MFFAEGEEKEFPEEIKEEIYQLESEDKEIYKLNKADEGINSRVILFVLSALNLFLKWRKILNEKQEDLMTEALGNISITFFILDKLKVKENVKKAINSLVDIINAHSNLHVNRERLIKRVYSELKNLQLEGCTKK